MKLSLAFNVAAGLACGLIAGAGVAVVATAPLATAGVVALGAFAGGAAASALVTGLTASFNGRGPSAGVAGIGVFALGHMAAVPAVAMVGARAALAICGLAI